MEEGKRELLERVYYAPDPDRAADALVEACHPDAEWLWPKGMADMDVYRGHDEIRRGVEAWLEPWVDFRFELGETLERGDEVLAIVRYRGRGKGSGLEIDQTVAHLWEFRGERASRLRMFGDVEKARRRFLEES